MYILVGKIDTSVYRAPYPPYIRRLEAKQLTVCEGRHCVHQSNGQEGFFVHFTEIEAKTGISYHQFWNIEYDSPHGELWDRCTFIPRDFCVLFS